MKDFYTQYYRSVASSAANADYCTRLYGQNLCQHGFAEMAHLDELARTGRLSPAVSALDLGCGNGGIANYLAERSGAKIVGIDYIPEAIWQAHERLCPNNKRLHFSVMDMACLGFANHCFDVVLAVDTLYFVPLEPILKQITAILKPGGCLVTFWSQSCETAETLQTFDRTSIHPDHTELATALQALELPYQAWDYSQADYDHAQRKLKITESLRDGFEADGNLFLYENHLAEAQGVIRAYEAGAHGRYLYRAQINR